MAFELRCKTPYGPFSSPELLDIKAPPAVHTAQTRIADWNREHNFNVAERHPHARGATRPQVGAAQYEVQHSFTNLRNLHWTVSSCLVLSHGVLVYVGPVAGTFGKVWHS